MDFDALTDQFVEDVNASPREPLDEYAVPPSIRIGTSPDEVYGMWDWNIKRYQDINWVEDLEAKLPKPFPKSFHSFISRYIFPQFEFGDLEFLANTPEGVGELYELRTGIFEDKHLSAALIENGFIQFARVAGGHYDPVCFDTSRRTATGECGIVVVDHEDILCRDKINVTKTVASSFHELIR